MDKKDYETFGGIAKNYWWFRAKRALVCKMLKLTSMKWGKILNIGCGMGEDIKTYSRFGDVHSIDKVAETIHLLNDKTMHSVMDAENMDFADESFDIVLMLDVLEHIKDDKKAMQEAARVLKVGGHAIITVPAYPFLYGSMDKYAYHERRYSIGTIRKMLADNNFTIERISFWNFCLFPFLAMLKIYKKLLRPGVAESDFIKLPRAINKMLFMVLKIENALIIRGLYLPFGISIVVLGRKK